MEYANLGNSDLKVSCICMGCMGFGNASTGQHSWTVDEETSKSIIKRGLELGINFFDTAIAYQAGTSEEYLGKAIREYAKRDEIVIATKFLPRSQEEIANGVSGKEHVLKSLNTSLSHLGMDYVDLYIYHMWDWNTPIEEYLEGLQEGVKSGKIRQIGIANCFAWQLAEANSIAREKRWPEFVSVQNHYNLIMREEEREMNVYAKERNIALTPYSALAAGRLSKRPGEISKRLEKDDYAKLKYDAAIDKDVKIITRVCEIADAHNVSMTEVALAWLLTKVTSPIVGATKISHVEGAVKALDLKLSSEEIKELEELYEPHVLSGVMAQNIPAARKTEQVWIKNGKYIKQIIQLLYLSYDKAKQSLENSLKELNIGYIDLVLIHWPIPLGKDDVWQKLNQETWKVMEEFYKAGVIKVIGVSNFLEHHLNNLLETAQIKTMVI